MNSQKAERIKLLTEQEDLFNKNCYRCGIMAAIDKAGHGRQAQQDYCNIICLTGKRLRELGQALDMEAIKGKILELNKSNLREFVERGLKNEELAKIFGVGTSTIARKKREFGLTYKNYNSSITKELYKKDLAAGMSRAEICGKYDIGLRTLVRKIKEWGMV